MIQQNYCKKNIEMQLKVDTESGVTKFFNITTVISIFSVITKRPQFEVHAASVVQEFLVRSYGCEFTVSDYRKS